MLFLEIYGMIVWWERKYYLRRLIMNTKHRYITGFDGIRTIAVLGVIFYHLFPNTIKAGYSRLILLK